MTSETSVPPVVRALLRRGAGFFALFAAVYIAVLFAGVNAVPGGVPGLAYTNVPAESPTRGGPAWLTHAELYDYEGVDILFVGSSHAYRTFDPRFFDRHGLRTFNLGTTAQTPLNTYYLLRDHLPHLAPKLVVFEVYWMTLAWDGTESALDLLSNFTPSWNLARMALATRDVRVVNGFLRRLLDVRDRPEPAPNLWEGDTYVGRGFVEKDPDFEVSRRWDVDSIDVSPRQLRYIEAVVDLVRERGAEIALIVQPLPRQTLTGVRNRRAIEAALHDLAIRRTVTYIDFNERMTLDPVTHFFDAHHLNRAGLNEFLPVLWAELSGLIPP